MDLDSEYQELISERDQLWEKIQYKTDSNTLFTFDIHAQLTTDLESQLRKLLWERDNGLHGVYHQPDLHNPYTWDLNFTDENLTQEIMIDIPDDAAPDKIETQIKESLLKCHSVQRSLRLIYWISSHKEHDTYGNDTPFNQAIVNLLKIDNSTIFKLSNCHDRLIDYDITIHLITEMLRNVYPYSFIDLIKWINVHDESYLIEKIICEISFREIDHRKLLDIKLPVKKPFQIRDLQAYSNVSYLERFQYDNNDFDMMQLRVDLKIDQNLDVRLGLKWEDCLSDTDHALLNYAAFYFELINRDAWHYKYTDYNSDVYMELRRKVEDVGRVVSAVTFAHNFLGTDAKSFRESRDWEVPNQKFLQMWEIFRYSPRECLYAIFSNLIDGFRTNNHVILPVYQLTIDVLLGVSEKFAHELLLLITYDYDPETLMPITGRNYINDQFAMITNDKIWNLPH